MVQKLKRLVVYAKVGFVVIVLAAIVVLVFKNRDYQTRFWPGAAEADVPTLWLILVTAILSILVFWILSKMRRVFTELSEIRAERAAQREQAAHEQRRRELDAQERRIDEKLKKGLEGDNSQRPKDE